MKYIITPPSPSGSGLKRPAEPDEVTGKEKRCHLDAASASDTTEVVRRKRRKYALLLSYCGKGYLGMQRYEATH